MSEAVASLQDDGAVAYLRRLQTLSSEVKTAIEAIATNRLQELEASVARQEMLAAGLVVLAKRAGEWLGGASADRELAGRVRSATIALKRLNLEYAALLGFAGRSAEMLSGLHRSGRGEMMEERGNRRGRTTWSCVA